MRSGSCEERFDDVVKTIDFPFWQVEALVPGSSRRSRRHCSPMHLLPITHGARRRKGEWTSGSRFCDTSRHCASTPRSTMARCPRNSPMFPCRCPLTRSPASRSATKSTGNTAHLRGTPPTGQEKVLRSNIHYEVTVQK